MGKKETLGMLASVSLFEGLSKRELDKVFGAAKEIEFPAGRAIVSEGQQGTAFHLILEGTAKVAAGGRTRATLGPGDYFGEMALLDNRPRSATVTTQSPVRTLSLASWSFLPLLDEVPSIAKKLLLALSVRLRDAERSVTL